MRLTYLYHSGFAVQAQGVTVVIDYWQDTVEQKSATHTAPEQEMGWLHQQLSHTGDALYVLSSHFHPDHFNPEVLTWRDAHPEIHYLFSSDIARHRRAPRDAAIYLHKGDCYRDDQLQVKAFGSTDVGISFLIDLQGVRLFHAGDLNNWHWSEESTPEEIRKAEGDYLAELRDLKREAPAVDVALFPVDRRMGRDYMRGATQFVEAIKTTTFVPMHFSEDYEGGNAFQPIAEAHGCRFIRLTRRGEATEI